jgi:hypothetical protein
MNHAVENGFISSLAVGFVRLCIYYGLLFSPADMCLKNNSLVWWRVLQAVCHDGILCNCTENT